MTPETDAEQLTAELNEFTAIARRIRADMDELYFLSLVSALSDAANKQKSQS